MSKSRNGFTLIEMLLVMLFIGTAFLSILQVFIASMSAEKDLNHTYIAMNLANEKMEEFYNSGFDFISGEATAEVSSYPGYWRSTGVSSIESRLKQLEVVVTWESGNYKLITYKSGY